MILKQFGLQTTLVMHTERYNASGHHVLSVDALMLPTTGNDKPIYITVPDTQTEALASNELFDRCDTLPPIPDGTIADFCDEMKVTYETDSPVVYVPFAFGHVDDVQVKAHYEYRHDVVEGWVRTALKDISV
jgi:hypothetical protein